MSMNSEKSKVFEVVKVLRVVTAHRDDLLVANEDLRMQLTIAGRSIGLLKAEIERLRNASTAESEVTAPDGRG